MPRNQAEPHPMPAPGGAFSAASVAGRQRALRERMARARSADAAERSTLPPRPPFASVIVLNRNGAAFLGRCLEHLIAQTYPAFEIIVVDNASTDASLEVIKPFLSRPRVSLVRSVRNTGTAGGRNLGARSARGEVLAFIDNDGFAAPTWLEEAVAALCAAPDIGAVGSLVFFDRNRLVLNGAGGTRNEQWYAGDLCFNQSYEFACLPSEVLYPMGCGMVLRRSVWERIGELDDILPKWFDDTELGIRVWRVGCRVVLAAHAHVDHGYRSSEAVSGIAPWRQDLTFQMMRYRTALKYAPKGRLLRWIQSELVQLAHDAAAFRPGAAVRAAAAVWNVARLGSALVLRRRFASHVDTPARVIDRSWGKFPPPTPRDEELHLDGLPSPGASLRAESAAKSFQLQFGWYPPEPVDGRTALRAAPAASAVLSVASVTSEFRCEMFVPTDVLPGTICIRELGAEDAVATFDLSGMKRGWSSGVFRVELPPAVYELLFIAEGVIVDETGRATGIAIAELSFV